MKRNQKLCIQIMNASRASEGSMTRLSHRDFEGTSINEFIEHCKLLDEEGSVETRLASGGVALIRLTALGHDFLDALEQEQVILHSPDHSSSGTSCGNTDSSESQRHQLSGSATEVTAWRSHVPCNESIDSRHPTFSQAQGYEDIPGPLALEELSSDARRRLWNLLYTSVKEASPVGPLRNDWLEMALGLHNEFLRVPVDEFSPDHTDFLNIYKNRILAGLEFNRVFDLLQMIMRHKDCPPGFTEGVKGIFERCQLAYCVDTNGPPIILPMATRQEGEAIVDALRTLKEAGLEGAETHLRRAGKLINQGDWSGSIRESINSVESIARRLDPDSANSLAPALRALESNHPIHSALREGLSKIYGYTSDEQGIRHALIDSPDSPSGRDEAVFMLGACASFASYLWRVTQGSDNT